MSLSEGGAPPRRRNTWLILSICLNVLLIAMIAVGMTRAWQRKHELAMGQAFSAESIVGHLPADRAAKVQAIIDAHAPVMKRLSDAATHARLNARHFFSGQSFDAAGYASAQQGIRAADDARQIERMKQLAEIAAILTPEERQQIVDRANQQTQH